MVSAGGNCAVGSHAGPRLGGRSGTASHVYEKAPIRCEPVVDVREPRPTKNAVAPHPIAANRQRVYPAKWPYKRPLHQKGSPRSRY